MHWISALLSSALVATTVGVSVTPRGAGGPEQEPQDRFYFEQDGERIDVRLGKKFTLNVDGKPVELELKVDPTRTFDTETFRFEYPRGMAYSYDGESPESWDLDTDPVSLQIQLHDLEGFTGKQLLGLIAEAMGEQYGDGLRKTTDVTIELGSAKYAGKRLDVDVFGEFQLTQTMFAVPGKTGEQVWILILTEDGDGQGPESKRFRKLLETTWELK